MSIVADAFTYVIGVDTHAKHHQYALLATATGQVLEQRSFPTSPAGLRRALAWIQRRTTTDKVLVAVEGTGSYGRTLTRLLLTEEIAVTEVRPPTKASRTRHGKTDQFDAAAAARLVLPADATTLAHPRQGPLRDALRCLTTARTQITKEKTACHNALTALLRASGLADARTTPTMATIKTIAAWRTHPSDDLPTSIQRKHAIRLAQRILTLHDELRENEHDLTQLLHHTAPHLLELPGIGPISAAIIIDAWSHPGRIHSEAAFAMLAGTAPLRIQSGNTDYHRLNRTGDRTLNSAIYRIAHTRIQHDPATKTYYDKRAAMGHSHRHILRNLKRYITRQLFRHLTNNPPQLT